MADFPIGFVLLWLLSGIPVADLGPGGVATAGRGAERLQGMVERGADGAQMVRRTWWSDRENPVTEGLP